MTDLSLLLVGLVDFAGLALYALLLVGLVSVGALIVLALILDPLCR